MSRIHTYIIGVIILALILPSAMSADWPECKFQCRANDVIVSRAWIGDAAGGDLPQGAPGEEQSCYLWVTLRNIANSPRYAAILLADVYIDGVLSHSFYDDGLCVLDKIDPKSSKDYPIYSMIWKRGDEIMFKRFVLSWETAKKTSCDNANRKCSNRNTKCYGGWETELSVEMPLSASFSGKVENCSREVNLFDETTGGDGSYTYDWDFGDGYHSIEKSPTHAYRNIGSYEVRLLVEDQSGRTSSFSQIFILNDCPCTIIGEDHTCHDRTDTYRAVINDTNSGRIRWYLDGIEIEREISWSRDRIDINWQAYALGEHYLQVYLADEREEGNQEHWAACNMTITILPEPEATISFSSER
jgi:PKD repeat protein